MTRYLLLVLTGVLAAWVLGLWLLGRLLLAAPRRTPTVSTAPTPYVRPAPKRREDFTLAH